MLQLRHLKRISVAVQLKLINTILHSTCTVNLIRQRTEVIGQQRKNILMKMKFGVVAVFLAACLTLRLANSYPVEGNKEEQKTCKWSGNAVLTLMS